MLALRILFVSILVLALQSSVEAWGFFRLFGAMPNFCLVFVVLIALRHGPFVGMLTGFLTGLVLDVYSYEHLGAFALSGCIAGYLAGLAEERTLHLEIYAKIPLLGILALLHNFIYLLAVYPGRLDEVGAAFVRELGGVVYTLALGGAWIWVLHRKVSSDHDS